MSDYDDWYDSLPSAADTGTTLPREHTEARLIASQSSRARERRVARVEAADRVQWAMQDLAEAKFQLECQTRLAVRELTYSANQATKAIREATEEARRLDG